LYKKITFLIISFFLVQFSFSQTCPSPVITQWTMTSDGIIFDGTNNLSIIGYELEYSSAIFTPGDGTATIYEFDSFPHTMTGLASGTYYFAMRSDCGGGDFSDYIGPDPWTTSACSDVYSLPYLNDFNDFDAWSSCNTFFDSDGDTNFWNSITYDTSAVGDRHAASFSWNNGTILFPDNWVIVGPIDLSSVSDATMTWKVRGVDASWCQENYTIYVGTEPTVANLTASTVQFNETLNAAADACGVWGNRSFDISESVGSLVYIGLRHHNVSDMYHLNIDDLAVTSESLGISDVNELDVDYAYNKTTKVVSINSPNSLLSDLIVYNMLGQVVTQKSSNSNSDTINMSSFGKGVYVVKVFSDNGSKTIRLINN
jgi:hypothetical protein